MLLVSVAAVSAAFLRAPPMRAATEMTGARAARPLAMCGDDADAAAQADIMRRMTEMRQRGMTDEQILEQIATEELFGTGIDVPKETPQALPLAGGADWGMWSQSESGMYLELNVPPDTSAQQVAVGVQVGFLDVRLADEPLLSGRLAQSMLSDVEWALDVRASDGQAMQMRALQPETSCSVPLPALAPTRRARSPCVRSASCASICKSGSATRPMPSRARRSSRACASTAWSRESRGS
jgi:hypothetical protein